MVSPPLARHGCTVSAWGTSGLATAVVAPEIRVLPFSPVSSFFSSSVLWSFGPSLPRRYSGFFATTASADFSRPFAREISPGKVQNLSSRAVRLYLMRLDDLGASLLPASLPPASGLAAGSYSYGREFATRFFQLHLAATPCVSLRLPSSAPIGSSHPIRFCPCWAHWRRASARCEIASRAETAAHPGRRPATVPELPPFFRRCSSA